MRTISVDTEVFARIWAHRIDGEEAENDILKRLLAPSKRAQPRRGEDSDTENIETSVAATTVPTHQIGKVRWRNDVYRGLNELGGKAHLSDIYARVRSIRRQAGRSLPATTDDIIRRELENNSAESEAYLGKRDWFAPADGKGAGVWELKPGTSGID